MELNKEDWDSLKRDAELQIKQAQKIEAINLALLDLCDNKLKQFPEENNAEQTVY